MTELQHDHAHEAAADIHVMNMHIHDGAEAAREDTTVHDLPAGSAPGEHQPNGFSPIASGSDAEVVLAAAEVTRLSAINEKVWDETHQGGSPEEEAWLQRAEAASDTFRDALKRLTDAPITGPAGLAAAAAAFPALSAFRDVMNGMEPEKAFIEKIMRDAVRIGRGQAPEIATVRLGQQEQTDGRSDKELLSMVSALHVASANAEEALNRADALREHKPEGWKAATEPFNAAYLAAVEKMWALWPKLARTPAVTLDGMIAKASTVGLSLDDIAEQRAGFTDADDGAPLVAYSVALDLAELTLRAGRGFPVRNAEVDAKPDDRALQSYRAWLELEYKSLTWELYPNRPEMLGHLYLDVAGARFHFRDEPPASTRAVRILEMFGLDWRADNSPRLAWQDEGRAA